MRTLPKPIEGKNLVGIFTIIQQHNYDEIRLGDKIVGDLCMEMKWVDNEESPEYTFYQFDSTEPFPTRKSYEECWLDILTTIANNQTLAIEFTIRVNRKVKKDIRFESVIEPQEVANV